MAILVFLTVVVNFTSCGKKEFVTKSREIKATAVHSSGQITKIDATERMVGMNCGVPSFAGMFMTADYPSRTTAVVLYIIGPRPGVCISSPGSFKFTGTFSTEAIGQPPVKYEINWQRKEPNITFTSVKDDVMAGHFDGVFYNGSDSVLVNGTFKGYFF